jgi:hypothetical protein
MEGLIRRGKGNMKRKIRGKTIEIFTKSSYETGRDSINFLSTEGY